MDKLSPILNSNKGLENVKHNPKSITASRNHENPKLHIIFNPYLKLKPFLSSYFHQLQSLCNQPLLYISNFNKKYSIQQTHKNPHKSKGISPKREKLEPKSKPIRKSYDKSLRLLKSKNSKSYITNGHPMAPAKPELSMEEKVMNLSNKGLAKLSDLRTKIYQSGRNKMMPSASYNNITIRSKNAFLKSDRSSSYEEHNKPRNERIEDLSTSKSIIRYNKKSVKTRKKKDDALSYTESTTKQLRMPSKRLLENIKLNCYNTKYDCIQEVATKKEFGVHWSLHQNSNTSANEDNDWDVYWSDSAISSKFFQQMKGYQTCNHFLGMGQIARKETLALTIKKLQNEKDHDEYDFIPRTWVLPAEAYTFNEFITKMKHKKKTGKLKKDLVYIIKPETGSKGKESFITKKYSEIPLKNR